MKFKLILSIVFSLLFVSLVIATPQFPDVLIYEGREYPIYGEPLEPFFRANPERRPKFCGASSGLWRGYVAYLEIVDKELFLNDIKIHTVNPNDPLCLKESKLSEVSPGGKPFKLDWFSRDLTAAHGKHIGGENFYDSWKVWEKYSVFKFEKGNLKNVQHFSNAEYQEYLNKLSNRQVS